MDGRNDEGTEEEQIEDRQEHEEEDTEEQQDEGAEDSDPEIAIQNIIMAPKLTELLPEKFSGKDEGQNAKAHLIECKNYMEHHEITTDANKIKAFNRCITGEALLWAADHNIQRTERVIPQKVWQKHLKGQSEIQIRRTDYCSPPQNQRTV